MTRFMKLLVTSLTLSLGMLVAQVAMGADDSANVKVVKKFYAELNQKNLKAAPTVLAKTLRQTYLPGAPREDTAEDVRDHMAAVYKVVPDLKYDLNNVASQGDVVFTSWTATGTRDAKPFKMEGMTMFRVSRGKIVSMVVAMGKC